MIYLCIKRKKNKMKQKSNNNLNRDFSLIVTVFFKSIEYIIKYCIESPVVLKNNYKHIRDEKQTFQGF